MKDKDQVKEHDDEGEEESCREEGSGKEGRQEEGEEVTTRASFE
jgi:hypothetical protein